MSAPANPKSYSSSTSVSSTRSRVYLRPRTKVWSLALCFVLMIGASVWAVLQPVRPDPKDTSWRTTILFPHETNPYARLQAVSCKDEYACRLNSVAVNGTDALPEVWAVGNVALVLHRAAGETEWKQLTINAVEESAPPKPKSSPTPTPKSDKKGKTAGARPVETATPVPTVTPTATPDQRVPVPNLLHLNVAVARKIAESQGFQISVVQGASDNQTNQTAQSKAPNQSAQQSAPPPQVVVKQSPDPKTLVPRNSTITITLGRPAASKASLLDKLLPTVYAAELEKRPQPQSTPVPHLSREQIRRALTPAPTAKPLSVVLSPFDDDLLHVACESGECRIFGRSGRVYKVAGEKDWTFNVATFSGVPPSLFGTFSLLNSMLDGPTIYGKAGNALYKCAFNASDSAPSFNCGVSSDKSLDLQIPGGSLLHLSLDQPDLNSGSLHMALRVVTHGPDAKDLVAAFSNVRSAATNSNLAVAVGEHGTILASTDNGGTWLHETQGPDGAAPNHKLPALWYWLLAALLMIISSVVIAIPGVPPVAEVSVADWAVTDAPLKPGDIDSLNFTPMALGLSRFIRNPKTQPPVTIAIEGEWGEGKSSVMSLLEGDLKKSRYRPVWFNAWHHQSEEQLLAALLEHIKDQAMPPWWHIDNWIFRARLLRIRMGRKWPLVVVLAIVFASTAAFEISRHGIDEFIQSPTNLIPYKDQILSLFKPKDKADQPSKDKTGEAASAGVKASEAQSSAQEPSGQKACKPEDKCDPGDLRHLGLIASFFGLLGAILKIAKAFGIDSSKLTDNLRDVTTIKDVKPDPGIRRKFAHEFGDLCEAWSWGGRRVIIFIDDLDRCRPESVVTVLESINFLTTAGDCMIVLGMAQKQVTHAVGLGFKDIAQSQQAYIDGCNTEQEKAIARFKYGELYIKKLVNIVALLPKTTSDQRRKVLESRAAQVRRQNEQVKASITMGWRMGLWEWLSESGRLAVKFAPVMAMLLAIVISILVGYQKGTVPDQGQAQGGSANISSTAPLINEGKNKPHEPTLPKFGEAKPLVYDRPTTEQAKLEQTQGFTGGSWWSYSSSALLLVIFFGLFGYQLSARTNQDAQNSPEFEKSLELWGGYIVGLCDTPREIKRALNDLRYQAMTRRMHGPSSTRGERLARALRQLVIGRKEPDPVEGRVDEAALPPLKAAALAALSADEEARFLGKDADTTYPGITETMKMLLGMKAKHIELFGRWIGTPAPEPPEPPDSGGDKAHARSA